MPFKRIVRNAAVLFLTLVMSVFGVGVNVCDSSDPLSLNDYAIQLLQKGEVEKALEQLQAASRLFPYDLTLRKNLAEVYTHLGQKRMSTGRYEEAARTFDNARELFPDIQRYRVLSGIALYSAKQYDAAIVELEQARVVGADTVDLLLFLGRAHYDNSNLPSAIEVLDKALEIQPDNHEINALVAKARRELVVEGKMDKGFSSRFVVSYDAGDRSNLADSILDALESAYNRVGSDFNHFPNARIPVLIYTKTDYRSLTNSPDWSGGMYDGKIRLPVGGATEVNNILRSLLFHEYTHVVIQDITSGNCPIWLNEGLAELEGRRDFNHPLKELEKAVRQKTLLPLSLLERSFSSLQAKDASLAYQQSYSFVKYLTSTYGWHKIKDILVNLGAGKETSAAVSTALSDLSVDYNGLYLEWLSSVEKEYSP
jgi:tetratricopeptide (TPR) repeat protein